MKSKDKILMGGISLIVLIVLVIVNFLSPKIEIKLNGDSNINLEVGTTYNELGAKAYIYKFFIKQKSDIKIEGTVDANKIGHYEISYSTKFGNHKKEVKREIVVVDTTAPTITLNKPINACKNNNIVELDAKVLDNYDGDITDNLEYKISKDKITLYAVDSSSNKAEIIKDLNYIDNEKPTIKINGSDTIYLKIGTEYIEQGATAYDSCDGNITANISITSNLDNNTLGNYEIVYSVTDKTGQMVSTTRKVVVGNDDLSHNGVIYLTFDDGPGQYTEKILNILDNYNIKATFFVTNQFPPYINLIKLESEKGHTIGIHTYSHKWAIYSSVDTYLEDFTKIEQIIYEQTGEHPKYFRFPGGSSNTVSKRHNKGIMTNLAKVMTEKGYVYFDWTFDSGDTNRKHNSKTDIVNNVKKYLKPNDSNIILMHDIKKNTMEALPTIIEYALSQGYKFEAINPNTPVKHFKISN